MTDSVIVDGVEYFPRIFSQNVKIVILQRGWVMVGRWSRDGDMVSLDDAKVIRIWGTKKGLGQLVDGPTRETVLDPTGHVEFHILTVVASIDVKEEAWQL